MKQITSQLSDSFKLVGFEKRLQRRYIELEIMPLTIFFRSTHSTVTLLCTNALIVLCPWLYFGRLISLDLNVFISWPTCTEQSPDFVGKPKTEIYKKKQTMFRKAPLGVHEREMEAATATRTVPERWTDRSYHCGSYRGTVFPRNLRPAR